MFKHVIISLFVLMFSLTVNAQTRAHDGKTHGLFFGFGNEDIRNDNVQGSLTGTVVSYQYQYRFTPQSSIKLGYIKGNSDNFGCYFFCIPNSADERHRFNSKQIKYQHTFAVSNRHAFYANVGVDLYEDIYYTGDGAYTAIKKGTGHNLGAGWQFRAHSGFGVGVEYNILWLGDTTAELTSVHFSWSF